MVLHSTDDENDDNISSTYTGYYMAVLRSVSVSESKFMFMPRWGMTICSFEYGNLNNHEYIWIDHFTVCTF